MHRYKKWNISSPKLWIFTKEVAKKKNFIHAHTSCKRARAHFIARVYGLMYITFKKDNYFNSLTLTFGEERFLYLILGGAFFLTPGRDNRIGRTVHGWAGINFYKIQEFCI